MRRLLALVAILALFRAAPAPALEPLAAPDADPPSIFTGYWLALGWPELPPRGPAASRGLVFWSHGVSGDRPQYQAPPHEAVRRLAEAGWDVVKIQRNPTFEAFGSWTASGVRHVADLARRAEAAKAEGYARVIAAGQSYGGAISIEASGRTAAIDAVLAFVPGHGSDAATTSHARSYENLTHMLVDGIGDMKAARVALLIAGDDPLHPHERRGPRLHAALRRLAVPFALFDETMPIKGHGAGATRQFDAWYGECLLDFLEREDRRPGETVCAPPDPLPAFLLPRHLRLANVPSELSPPRARLAGAWSGRYPTDGDREVLVALERIAAGGARLIYAVGSGPSGSLDMGWGRWDARWVGDSLFARSDTGNTITLTARPDGAVDLVYALPDGSRTWPAVLTPHALD